MKHSQPFRFKQFSVQHSQSAHKVGVDGVLLGAWAASAQINPGRILDVGCGCGLISLMLAQRFPDAKITAIDIHRPSVDEARYNVSQSGWSNRIEIEEKSFDDFVADNKDEYDIVVSNPPYFDSGVVASTSARMTARHCGDLSPAVLLEKGVNLLTPTGVISLIMPCDDVGKLIIPDGYCLSRKVSVRDNLVKSPKRVLLEIRKGHNDLIDSELVLKDDNGQPTEQYLKLCHDFYMAF